MIIFLITTQKIFQTNNKHGILKIHVFVAVSSQDLDFQRHMSSSFSVLLLEMILR
jgi:hypothetical protein